MESSTVTTLRNILGDEFISTSPVDRKVYASSPPATSGDFLGKPPDVIVMPRTAEQVSRILRVANATKTSVIPRAGGTGYVGMGVPKEGGIMLDMSLMNRILTIDEDSMVVVAEGGTSTYKIQYQLDRRGLRLPVIPLYTTGPQIGSAVACNMSGHYMNRYGRLGENLTGLEVVLPTGEIVTVGSGAYRFGPGHYHKYMGTPDVMGLFINSAGTMGVVTKAAVKVVEKPEAETILCYGWGRDEAEECARAQYRLLRGDVYDLLLLNRWNYYFGIKLGKVKMPEDTHFIALITVDGRNKEELEAEVSRKRRICEEEGGVDLGDLGRFTMGSPYYRTWLGTSAWMGRHICTYFYCPVNSFPDAYDLWENTCKKYGFWTEDYIPAWFSFSDRVSINPYPMLAHYNPTDPEELKRAEEFWAEFHVECTRRGFVQYLMGDSLPLAVVEELGPVYDLVKRIKRTLDPNNIMNPSLTYG